MKETEIIIIGAGASGLMAASLLPPNTATVIESGTKAGNKLLISGGGKCNITNRKMETSCFLGEAYFIEPALSSFDNEALLTWLRGKGLNPVVRKETQYFCPHSAKEIVQLFQKESQKQQIRLNEKVISVTKKGNLFVVKTEKQVRQCKKVVVASGGLSYPQVGVSDIGYTIARHFGHTIETMAPALVGFTVQKSQFFFKELSGSSTDVEIYIDQQVTSGALLFTHRGISGPAVLDASLYWKKGNIVINFLPGFDWSLLNGNKKQLSTLLPLPKRITKAFLLELKIDDKRGLDIAPGELSRLKQLQSYSFAPAGTFGYTKAEVTRGGISTEEINPYTMESQKEEGLYFTGEVLDVTGRLGGYNFQWAFSSAFLCAEALSREPY